MKLTKSKLKQLIKEELQNILQEDDAVIMATLLASAKTLRKNAQAECGRKAAQLEATLRTGDPRFLKKAYQDARTFQQCERGTDLEYKIETLAQSIGQQLDSSPA
jgi:hypothetical protein